MATGIIIGVLSALASVSVLFLWVSAGIIRDNKKEIDVLKARLAPMQDSDSIVIDCKPGMRLMLEMTDKSLSVRNMPLGKDINQEEKCKEKSA